MVCVHVPCTLPAFLQNLLGKLLSYFKSEEEVPQIDTHWMSESGIMDIFILLGPRPYDVFEQYASLTGTPPLPPVSCCSESCDSHVMIM